MRRFQATLAVAFLFLATIPAGADEWTKADTAFQLASSALIVADWGQTLDIADNPGRWRETNRILSDHPSRGRVNAYFAACLIGNAAIARILPQPYRRTWQALSIGVEAYYVRRNYALGIRVGF